MNYAIADPLVDPAVLVPLVDPATTDPISRSSHNCEYMASHSLSSERLKQCWVNAGPAPKIVFHHAFNPKLLERLVFDVSASSYLRCYFYEL